MYPSRWHEVSAVRWDRLSRISIFDSDITWHAIIRPVCGQFGEIRRSISGLNGVRDYSLDFGQRCLEWPLKGLSSTTAIKLLNVNKLSERVESLR